MAGQPKLYQQKKIVARRRKRTVFMCLFTVAAAGILFSGLSFISQLDSLSIDTVIVLGNSRLSTAVIQSAALEKLSGNYVHFFSRTNTLLYPKSSIQKTVAAMPLVKRADVSRRGLKTIVLSVTERTETALFCEGKQSDTASCFSMDENGFVFAPATTSPRFIYRGLIAADTDPIGKNFLSPDAFKQIQFFIRELDGLSVLPREASITENGYMTVVLAQGGKLVVNTMDDLSSVLANIASVISDKSIAPSFADFLRGVDYVKFDTGNKVVYKMRS